MYNTEYFFILFFVPPFAGSSSDAITYAAHKGKRKSKLLFERFGRPCVSVLPSMSMNARGRATSRGHCWYYWSVHESEGDGREEKNRKTNKDKKNLQINRLYKIEFSWSFFPVRCLCCWMFVVAGGECCAPVVCFFLSTFYFVTLAFIYCTQRIVLLCRMADCVCSCTKLFLIASCLMLCARIPMKKTRRASQRASQRASGGAALFHTYAIFGMDSKWMVIIR